jgi:dipeptidyl aminopeptidase/acylaminoacyl peptidase
MDFGAVSSPYARLGNFSRALANLGFVVVSLDGRGTPGRSKVFHDVIYHNWGNFEIADHAGALRQLGEKLGFLDLTRVGIHGGSWGGHYAFRALTQAPDLYQVAIAEFPGFDSRAFTLYEVYLGMPQDNKALYDAADAFALAPKVRGKLLLTSGTNDTGTMKDMFKMSEQLVRLGIQHDVMVYPNTGHGAMGKSGEYNFELKLRYFVDNLKP